jgi:hypothetical protein
LFWRRGVAAWHDRKAELPAAADGVIAILDETRRPDPGEAPKPEPRGVAGVVLRLAEGHHLFVARRKRDKILSRFCVEVRVAGQLREGERAEPATAA